MSRTEKKEGYVRKNFLQPVKRYCQTLDLKDDPELIREYIKRHSKVHQWPEIREGIRSVGILEMEIYHIGTRLFMIVETPPDFEWDSAFEKLAKLPRQSEWEEYMSIFQQADANATSSEKWKLMERIFYLYNDND
jgi:L-rhamnose mutarotase